MVPVGSRSDRTRRAPPAWPAFGEPVNTYYKLENADVIVSLDADFLTCGPVSTRYARAFADKRRVRGTQTGMNRLYVVESTPSPTGGKADHRLPLRAADIELYATALAAQVGVAGAGALPPELESSGKWPDQWLTSVAKDLLDHKGASVVIPGEFQSPIVHVLAAMMNQALGNVGNTVVYTTPLEVHPVDQNQDLRSLVGEMNAGAVDLLVILGGNPVFTAPVDLGFKEALGKAKTRIHLGLYSDETAALCQWHVPETHFLETWSDTRAFDGTFTIMQPLIQPLYRGRSAHELLTVMTNQGERSAYDIIRGYWQAQKPAAEFEAWWRKSVHDGVVPEHGSAAAHRNRSPRRRGCGPQPQPAKGARNRLPARSLYL